MLHKLLYAIMVTLLLATSAFGQKTARTYLRSGNKLYKDSTFVKAEVDYRKALDKDPKSADAMYNLGNSLLMQQKAKDAMEQYEAAAQVEKDKSKLSHIYHNMGVILQSSKQYPQCIEAYKKALRNNPKDDETRYNLALAQKMLRDQQQKQNQDKQKEQKQDQKKDDKQKNKEQQDQKNKEQQQNQQKQQQNQMSKQNAEQLLKAAMQDEKNVQDKVKKNVRIQGHKLDKDW